MTRRVSVATTTTMEIAMGMGICIPKANGISLPPAETGPTPKVAKI